MDSIRVPTGLPSYKGRYTGRVAVTWTRRGRELARSMGPAHGFFDHGDVGTPTCSLSECKTNVYFIVWDAW